jgi:hypothetical protein
VETRLVGPLDRDGVGGCDLFAWRLCSKQAAKRSILVMATTPHLARNDHLWRNGGSAAGKYRLFVVCRPVAIYR